MKKLLHIAMVITATLGFISCGDDGLENGMGVWGINKYYTGVMTVTTTVNGESVISSSYTDVSYDVFSNDILTDNSTITITMNNIQFIDTMPALDIILPDISSDSYGGYFASSVVPTKLNGEPYDTSTINSIDKIYATYTVYGDIIITYTCTIPTTTENIVYSVTYNGIEEL